MTPPAHIAQEWMVLALILVPLTAVASIVVNAILIAAIRTRGKWDTTDTIFFALTISDCLHGIVSLVGAFTRILIFFDREIGDVLFPIMMTTFYYFLFNLPALISKTLTAMLSIERTIAVFNPAKFKIIWSKRRVIVMMCCVVFLITATGFPRLFQLRGTVNHNDTSSFAFTVKLTELASGNRNSLFIYNLVCQNIFGTLPIILVFVLNLATIVGFRRHKIKVTSEGNDKHVVNRNNTVRVTTSRATKYINKMAKPGKLEQEAPLTESKIPASISNQPFNQRDVTDCNQMSVTGSPCTSGQQAASEKQNVLKTGHKDTRVYSIPMSSMSCNEGVSTDSNLVSSSSGSDLGSTDVSSSETKKTRDIRSRPKSTSMSIAQKRITVTLITIATVFVILNLPGKIIGPIFLQRNAATSGIFQIYDLNTGIGKYLELLNSVVNSIIYVMRSQKYMAVVNGMFTCCR